MLSYFMYTRSRLLSKEHVYKWLVDALQAMLVGGRTGNYQAQQRQDPVLNVRSDKSS